MSSVDTESKVPLEALPEYTQTQLKSGIATQSRKDAQQILHDVRITAQQSCPVVAPSPAESGGADGSEGSSGDNATAEHAVPEWCDELRGDIQ